ncbi:hypothetical protein NC651_026169 [Populus alba x Populus x berolinensis]|nr:hypothetical protein NC651_026169 [Populus alba x Populus x berolinensis]
MEKENHSDFVSVRVNTERTCLLHMEKVNDCWEKFSHLQEITWRPSLRTHHEEKASSSDNENSPATKGGEFQKRICDKGTMKEKRGKPVVASDRPGKGDKLHKHNIHHSDGAKYMSYLKISKKQHQLTHQVNEEQRSYSIDLELKVHEEDIGKDLMHGQSDDGLLNYFDEAKYDLVCEGGVIFTLV